jgi:hypothetical protein
MTATRAPSPMSAGHAALLDAFALHLATRPPHTRKAYLRDVAQLLEMAGETPVSRLARAQLMRFVATLHGRGLSGRSLARTLSAWRALYRFLIERDRTLADDPCAGIKAPKSSRRLPSALSPEEAARLVTITGDDPLSLRDCALLELAYSSGLRLSELAQLDVAGCDLTTGEVRVLGKGSKERIVPVGAAARDSRTTGRNGDVHRTPRSAPVSARDPAAPRGMGDSPGPVAPRPSAHAAAFVRVARAAIVGRSSGRAGDARPCVDRQHAGLHAPRFPGAGEGVRRRASAREAEAPTLVHCSVPKQPLARPRALPRCGEGARHHLRRHIR